MPSAGSPTCVSTPASTTRPTLGTPGGADGGQDHHHDHHQVLRQAQFDAIKLGDEPGGDTLHDGRAIHVDGGAQGYGE